MACQAIGPAKARQAAQGRKERTLAPDTGENQTLINHKCVCGARNRHFCKTPVIGSTFLSSVYFILHQSSRCQFF